MFEGRLPTFANTRSLARRRRARDDPAGRRRRAGNLQRAHPVDEALARDRALYKPYHQALRALIERARPAPSACMVLLDCHSMPSSMADGAASDFVIGDRYGASAAPWIVESVESALRRAGYSVRRNKPYAGGFITEHYGAPAASRHVVQIEINRALYMDERAMAKSERWGELSSALLAMASQLANRIAYEIRRPPIAAE